VNALVVVTALASWTWRTKFDCPAVVGVPVRDPAELTLRPAGSDPLTTVHAYGGLPPDAESAADTGTPTTAFANDEVIRSCVVTGRE